MPLLIMFFQPYANWDLMEPILRSVRSFDLECGLLQMAAALVKQFVASGWMMYAWVLRQRSTAVLNFMWVWLIKKWFGAYKKFQLLSNKLKLWILKYNAKTTYERTSLWKDLFHRKSHRGMKLFLGFCKFWPFSWRHNRRYQQMSLAIGSFKWASHSTRHLYARDFIAYHSGGGRNKPASVSQPNICTHLIHSRKTEWLKRTLLSGFFFKLICMLIGIISDKRNA